MCHLLNVHGVHDASRQSMYGWTITGWNGCWKAINHQVLIKFQQKWFKQEAAQCILRSLSLLILFGIRKTCLNSRRWQSLYLLIQRVIKQTVVIIKACHCYQLHSEFIQHSSLKIYSICRWNYLASTVWMQDKITTNIGNKSFESVAKFKYFETESFFFQFAVQKYD